MHALAFLSGACIALLLPGAGLAAPALLLGTLAWLGRRHGLAVPAGIAFAALLWAQGVAATLAARPVPCDERLLVEAVITSIPAHVERGWRFDAQVSHPRQPWLADLAVRIDFPRQGALRPRAGERWQLLLGYRAAPPPQGSVGARVMLRNRVHAQGRVVASPLNQRLQAAPRSLLSLRESVAGRIDQRVQDPSAAALIAALAVGATGEVSRRQWRVFSATGISHLVAISGMHVTFFALLSMKLARWLWAAWPLLRRRLRREVFAAATGVLLATAYALLSGFSVPAQRTLVMLAVFLLLREAARATRPTAALAAALVLVLAWDPLAVLDAGFWLSFVAVAAIILLPGSHFAPPRPLAAAVEVQWVVSLVLLPLTLVLFGMFSLSGLVVNALAIPLFSFLLVPVVLLATLGYLLPGAAAAWTAGQLVDLAQWLVKPLWSGLAWVAGLPGAVLLARPGLLVTLMACASVVLVVLPLAPRVRAWAGAVLAWSFVAALPAPARHLLEVEVLDAGGRAVVLLRTAGHVLLAGSAERFGSGGQGFARLQPLLASRTGARVDGWVIGRLDADRLAGLAAARAGGRVERAYGVVAATRALPPAVSSCADQQWQWDGVRFELGQAASGKGCLLRVLAGVHRTVVLVDGVAQDGAMPMPDGRAPQLWLAQAQGFAMQGEGVQGARRVAIDGAAQRVLPAGGLGAGLRGTPAVAGCSAPDQAPWHQL